ncbi:MAG TPA: DUF3108 domain-containing protein [Anaeromyxobacteraceae bacterium]|nr:DUF3108 domain-containing protein [Anaeromyxobacteraceae bacterium]
MIATTLALLLAAAQAPEKPTPAAAPATAAPAPAAPGPKAVLAPDEQMDFVIDWVGVKMGKARIAVGHPAGQLVPIFLQAQTAGVVGFITVRQQLQSNLDAETGLPRSSSIDALEPGNYHHTDTARYQREDGKAIVREKGKYDNTYEVPVPAGTLDFLALVFRLRVLPLEVGARHEFPVLSGRKVAQVVAEVVGRETVETKVGTFQAFKVRVPTGFDGKFKEKSPSYVWFSDDARRVVVRLSTDFAIGRANADLVAYQPGQQGG